jgi:hypothetical protein
MLLEGPLPDRGNLRVVDLNLVIGECGARSGQQHDQAYCHCLHVRFPPSDNRAARKASAHSANYAAYRPHFPLALIGFATLAAVRRASSSSRAKQPG